MCSRSALAGAFEPAVNFVGGLERSRIFELLSFAEERIYPSFVRGQTLGPSVSGIPARKSYRAPSTWNKREIVRE